MGGFRQKPLQFRNPWPIYRLSFRDCVINGRFHSSEISEISHLKTVRPHLIARGDELTGVHLH